MTEHQQSPRRLIEADDEVAKVLRADSAPPTASDEVQAWDALERRLEQPRRSWRFVWAAAVAVAAVALLAVWIDLPNLHRSADAPAVTAEPASQMEPTALPIGGSRLPDGSRAVVDAESIAIVTAITERETRVELRQGSVGIEAVRQEPDRQFVVVAVGHEFRVVGTRFTVTAGAAGPRLEVAEGIVEVWRQKQRLARVRAGSVWPETGLPDSAASTVPSAPPSETTPDCLQLTRSGKTSEVEACLKRRVASGAADAELALYELARLRQNVHGDSSGAIATLRSYQRRFPSGALRSEVQLTLIELLNASGRAAEAAREARALLTAGAAPERASELHFVVAREFVTRGDCTGAEPHLQAAIGVSPERVASLRKRCTVAKPDAPAEPDAPAVPTGHAAFELP
jgi:hypothetical protein